MFRDLVEPGLEWCGDVVGVSSGMSGVDPDAAPTIGVASIDTGRPLSQPAVSSSVDEAHDTVPNTYWGASTPGCDPSGLDADQSLAHTVSRSLYSRPTLPFPWCRTVVCSFRLYLCCYTAVRGAGLLV